MFCRGSILQPGVVAVVNRVRVTVSSWYPLLRFPFFIAPVVSMTSSSLGSFSTGSANQMKLVCPAAAVWAQ